MPEAEGKHTSALVVTTRTHSHWEISAISVFPTMFYLYYHRHHSHLRSNEPLALERKHSCNMHTHAHMHNVTQMNTRTVLMEG